MAREELADALARAQLAEAVDGSRAEAPLVRALALWREDGSGGERALDVLNTLVDRGGSADAFSARAIHWHNLAKFDKAVLDATAALALDHSSALAYLVRGDSYKHGPVKSLNHAPPYLDDYSRALDLDTSGRVRSFVGRGFPKDKPADAVATVLALARSLVMPPRPLASYNLLHALGPAETTEAQQAATAAARAQSRGTALQRDDGGLGALPPESRTASPDASTTVGSVPGSRAMSPVAASATHLDAAAERQSDASPRSTPRKVPSLQLQLNHPLPDLDNLQRTYRRPWAESPPRVERSPRKTTATTPNPARRRPLRRTYRRPWAEDKKDMDPDELEEMRKRRAERIRPQPPPRFAAGAPALGSLGSTGRSFTASPRVGTGRREASRVARTIDDGTSPRLLTAYMRKMNDERERSGEETSPRTSRRLFSQSTADRLSRPFRHQRVDAATEKSIAEERRARRQPATARSVRRSRSATDVAKQQPATARSIRRTATSTVHVHSPRSVMRTAVQGARTARTRTAPRSTAASTTVARRRRKSPASSRGAQSDSGALRRSRTAPAPKKKKAKKPPKASSVKSSRSSRVAQTPRRSRTAQPVSARLLAPTSASAQRRRAAKDAADVPAARPVAAKRPPRGPPSAVAKRMSSVPAEVPASPRQAWGEPVAKLSSTANVEAPPGDALALHATPLVPPAAQTQPAVRTGRVASKAPAPVAVMRPVIPLLPLNGVQSAGQLSPARAPVMGSAIGVQSLLPIIGRPAVRNA